MIDRDYPAGSSDPLMPSTSRFPLSPGSGPFIASPALPSGSDTRPFGMSFGVCPFEAGKHSKKPTQKSRSKPTEITDDGQVIGTKTDTEYYTEMDEE
jgi:hypothetical protein